MSVLSQPQFHDEAAAFAYVEAELWPNGPVCPHCGGFERISVIQPNAAKRIRLGLKFCGQCRKQFTVRVGTIFEESKLPLHKWLQAIYLLCSSKKGISSKQIERTLECTYKTAWFLTHRIREAMRSGELAPFGSKGGAVEADETYIGREPGKPVSATSEVHDPLTAGFYSLREAARLLGLHDTRKLRGWLDGWSNSSAGPIVQRDFEEGGVSFLDLMELRFIDHFTRQGVPLQTLRRAAERARHDWNVKHPLALSNLTYLTDRRRVFGQVAEEVGDKRTWDLATNQYEMWAAIENVIAKGVEFAPATELAMLWHPRSDCPDVVIDPKRAFGRPVISEQSVPTVALYRQWRAEGSYERVASWFRVDSRDVQQAVEFELLMAA